LKGAIEEITKSRNEMMHLMDDEDRENGLWRFINPFFDGSEDINFMAKVVIDLYLTTCYVVLLSIAFTLSVASRSHGTLPRFLMAGGRGGFLISRQQIVQLQAAVAGFL